MVKTFLLRQDQFFTWSYNHQKKHNKNDYDAYINKINLHSLEANDLFNIKFKYLQYIDSFLIKA